MDEEALEFIASNSDLPIILPGVVIHFAHQLDGKLRMMLELGPATTQQNLRDAWPSIQEWKKRLTSRQGAWAIGGSDEIYERLLREKNRGASYGELAQRVNLEIEEVLAAFVESRRELPDVEPSWDWLAGPGRAIFAVHRARQLLKAMQPTKDPETWIKIGTGNLEVGQPAFPLDLPVTLEDVRERLRSWSRKLER